jgi:SNF2 family DNA or RNA helicase
LVVAPSSLLYHWKAEIERFLSGVFVSLYAGPERKLAERGIVVTSYAILRQDEEILSRGEFGAVVLDESNAIKTAATQTARATCRLKGRIKIALTGTPIENRPDEFWSQFRFLMPELFGERSEFHAAGFEVVRRKAAPFVLKRSKREVEIELPEKIEQVVWVEMEEGQRRAYESCLAASRRGLDGASRMEILEAILRLRQICCDPRLYGGETGGAKLEMLLQDLDDAPERKILIYSQFTSMLSLIGNALAETGREFLYLDGSVPAEERAARVRSFQEEEKPFIFLLSLKAGGVGLNLTAAETVILFDPWWNEAVERQAIDRAHRIGQKKSVIAKRYIAPDSIEEKMLRIKEEKKGIAEQLLDGEAFSWTEEDLLRLLF